MFDKYYLNLKSFWQSKYKKLLFCIVVTLILGIITHGYVFFNSTLSHDSLNEFYGNNTMKIELGRFIVPLYKALTRGDMALSWIIGIYSLLWIGCSVFLITEIFNVEQKYMKVLISAILTTNVTFSATAATYIHDLDSYMFAIFLATSVVYLLRKLKYGFLVAIPFTVCVFGIYQSYISVVVTLIIISSILDLLNGYNAKKVFNCGVLAIVTLAISAIIYAVLLKLLPFMIGATVTSGKYNTLDNIIPITIVDFLTSFELTYRSTAKAFLGQISLLFFNVNIISVILVLMLFILLTVKIQKQKLNIKSILLIILLNLLLPSCMNIACLFSKGTSHDLMYFSVWLTYLYILFLVIDDISIIFTLGKNKQMQVFNIIKVVCIFLVVLIIMNNIVLANKIYLKKEFEQKASFAYFTMVLKDIQKLEEYDPNVMKVMFIGMPSQFQETPEAFTDVKDIVGLSYNYVMGTTFADRYEKYFTYVLNYPISTVNYIQEEYGNFQEIIDEMKDFPANNSIKIVEDILIVKLGNSEK